MGRVRSILASAILLWMATACQSSGTEGGGGRPMSRLRVSTEGRFLVKEDGSPFFWLGDTAWGLPLLGPEDVRHYLDDRVAKRFNVIQVDCDGYGNPNYAGEMPFVQGDPDRPNETYWSHLDFILDEAEKRSVYVALTVMWGAVHSKSVYSGGYLRFGGDARKAGRLTLNPLRHVDPLGSIILPGVLLLTRAPFLFGWAKPVPVDSSRLRHPVNDHLKVALAGPASNVLLAIMFAALTRVAPEEGFLAPLRRMGYAGVVWNCALALFNLIPIPPLDGSWVLMRFLPLRHIIVLQQFRLAGMVLIVALLSMPVVANTVLYTPLRFAVNICLGLFGVPSPGIVL